MMNEILKAAQKINNEKKGLFLDYAYENFGQAYTFPEGLAKTPWTYILNQYIELSNRFPHNKRFSIEEILTEIDVNSLWTDDFTEIYEPAMNFMWASQFFMNKNTIYASEKKQQKFTITGADEGMKFCYFETFKVPNHAGIIAQTDNIAASRHMTDVLYSVPEIPIMGIPRKHVSVKLIDTNENPMDYLARLNAQIKSFSLPKRRIR